MNDDEKYLAESSDGRKLLVKISDIKDFDKKKAEFAAVERISQLGIPMMIPIKFGTLLSENLVYMVFSWIEGDEAENAMPSLSVSEQKQLGYDSGVILKKIHSVNAPAEQMDWAKRFYLFSDPFFKFQKERFL